MENFQVPQIPKNLQLEREREFLFSYFGKAIKLFDLCQNTRFLKLKNEKLQSLFLTNAMMVSKEADDMLEDAIERYLRYKEELKKYKEENGI